jgi:molecular chaperone GrpE
MSEEKKEIREETEKEKNPEALVIKTEKEQQDVKVEAETEPAVEEKPEIEKEQPRDVDELNKELSELKDKYLRLYADFENYKRLVAKNKEELIKYSNEDLMRELLPVIDHLELALQHSAKGNNLSALAEGVQMTLKELTSILEKFGLTTIESLGKPFDPSLHHAISQTESEEMEENMVIEEFRKGYKLKDRVLRAALVSVSKKPDKEPDTKNQEKETKEEG